MNIYPSAELIWQVGFSKSEDIIPSEYVDASVPGAVQLDWAKAKGMPDWQYSLNARQYRWMEDVFWHYKTQMPDIKGEQLFLCSGGIDYKYKVVIGGETRFEHEGMFTPFEINVSDVEAGTPMEIIVFPAPKQPITPGEPLRALNRDEIIVSDVGDRREAAQSAKPAVSYGWDWHPRLIPLGIWEEIRVEARPFCHIKQFEALYTMSNDLKTAHIEFNTMLSFLGHVRYDIFAPNGEKLLSTFERNIDLEEPLLWWPNGYGEQNLYTITAKLVDDSGTVLDVKSTRIGFRELHLDVYPGAWSEPDTFPKTRSNPPTKLIVNNVPVFARGSNWVNPEVFPGTITYDRYLEQIKLAKDANFNIFRVWGGGIINKESFFDICDEMGILVWQEFPLACNNYVGTKEYLDVLDEESKAIIKRLRHRACLALWCGGNELFNGWSAMTEQSLALRLLNSNCYIYDRQRPFFMTSPLMGMAHGCYLFKYQDGREVYEAMNNSDFTAYTEFGVPSISPVENLRAVIPADELFPIEKTEAWVEHHGFEAWGAPNWLCLETLEGYFGKAETLEELQANSSWLSCEGYKAIFEEARRQKPRCSMAINWCYQEPWMTAANNSLIAYPNTLKPAYFAVKDACRHKMFSLRIEKFSHKVGEKVCVTPYVLNDTSDAIKKGEADIFIEYDGKKEKVGHFVYGKAAPYENFAGEKTEFTLPDIKANEFTLIIGDGETASSYRLLKVK